MNENNQNIRNEQTPENLGGQENIRQENVYTVGAYDAPRTQEQQTSPTTEVPPENPSQAPQSTYTAPSGNTYTYSVTCLDHLIILNASAHQTNQTLHIKKPPKINQNSKLAFKSIIEYLRAF
jgi:hypothetical protein